MDVVKAFVVIALGVLFVLVLNLASDVGKVRAIAQIECYKAAQVNMNITCELKKDK